MLNMTGVFSQALRMNGFFTSARADGLGVVAVND
jgi:hypothetical protein